MTPPETSGSYREANPPVTGRAFAAWTLAGCLVFAAYAGSFLYFFVDDEAIPLVYARNLLRGRGFVYTALEGRIEGYSDFLHVVWSSVLLAVGRAFGQPLTFPLLAGKAVSFCAGLSILVVTARVLRRSGVTPAGMAAALGFLALAGPLAVWSCSSLETTMFALLLSGFASSLLPAVGTSRRWLPVGLGTAVLLERIDGVLFVCAVLFATWAAEPKREREIARIAWPVALAAVLFHGWRYAYFGSLLSAPLAAKVLYRLKDSAQLMSKGRDEPYLVGFLRLYGLAALPVFALASVVALRHAAGRMAVVALLLLGIYVAVVSDWMFGWRFLVALLPFAAVVIGLALGRLPRTAGWCAAAAVVVWSGSAASRFQRVYIEIEKRPLFWSDMHRGQAAWLAPYADLIVASRRLMHSGDRVAYNQAGLLPYLLDLENIDDLGICSRFVAGLPTTDVYFTAVGRYSPLTNQPVLRTAHAYLLYRDVQFLVARNDLLWRANGDHIPETLLDGLFTRQTFDDNAGDTIYRRTGKPADAYRRDAALFTENLGHPAMLTRASIDAESIPPAAFGPELPFLRERGWTRTLAPVANLDLGLGRNDVEVRAFFVERITARLPCTLTLSLADGSGRETLRRSISIAAGGVSVLERFEAPVQARAASITIESPAENRVTITDMRIEGQSPALREYLRRTLRFPPS